MAGSAYEKRYTFNPDVVGDQIIKINISNKISVEEAQTTTIFMREVSDLQVSLRYFFHMRSMLAYLIC